MTAKNPWCKTISVVLLVIGSFVSPSHAAESKKNQPPAPEQTVPRSNSNAGRNLRVSINASTARIIEGAVYGLNADIENVSDIPVSVDINQIQLAVQPELAPPNISCTWFYTATSNDAIKSPIVLQPGDHFPVFFDTGQKAGSEALKNSPDCPVGNWGSLRKRLDFVPGNFAFVMTGAYSILPPASTSSLQGSATVDPAASPKFEQHYFTETASLPVTIDQAQMILYAGLGGLLAFLVMSFRNADTLWEYAGKKRPAQSTAYQRSLIILREASAAILLSATVTVVAGRLSETAFPVKVSVDDFWGALTIGFGVFFHWW